jgi:menaquinone-dependent protoporphyrinogen IX oxidase
LFAFSHTTGGKMEITEAIAIELTKNLLINGQDEKPRDYRLNNFGAIVILSDGRSKFFNRVEVEHARIMTGEKK